MRFLAFTVATIAFPLVAPAEEKDEPALEGKWVLVSVEGAGIKLGEAQLKQDPRGFVFKDGKVESFLHDTVRGKGTIAVEPAKTPKQVDIVLSAVGSTESETVRGIYQLGGDRLTLCNRKPGEERPAEFVADDVTMISVYQRDKQ